MSLIVYFAIFQFLLFSQLYQHPNPSSFFHSFFLLRNACSTGVFCMFTGLLVLALSKFVAMLSWEKWMRRGWGPSPPPHNPSLAPLLLLKTTFCLSPSLLWGWIQDGACLIKLHLLVKIHLLAYVKMIMASLLKTNPDCFTQGHKSTYQMIHLLWCRHVLWSLQM